ncbi:PEX25 (YPL112C) and PEX27 (YOR193W) [Zygosaccharomyces parabailii]|nr:PEX25 (YPL112C) and PEX27 (YOR193W) [Zygosaccharomyces parabailii]
MSESPIIKEEKAGPVAEKQLTVTPAPPAKHVVRNLEILEYLIGTIAGTDKIAKVAKYTLDVIRRIVLSCPHSMLARIASLIPKFDAKTTYASTSLSTYRYILRFGYTPFVLSKLIGKLRASLIEPSRAQKIWNNEESLGQLVDLYYGIFDELDTLYRLRIWQNPSLYDKVVKHECWAWQISIVLGLKKNWLKLQQTKSQITKLEVQRRVSKHAIQLSANLQSEGARPDSVVRQQLLQDLNKNKEGLRKERETERQLAELRHRKLVTCLDIARLSFDCAANCTDIFNISAPAYTYSVLSLGSGTVGLFKMWINAALELSAE